MHEDDRRLPVTSSTAPEFVPEATTCYREALATLTGGRIPFAVAGAFAMQKHSGIWRDTKDLDIVLEARHIPAATQALQRAGFETLIKDPVWLAKAYKGEYFVDLITALGNAVLMVDEEWITRALPDEVFGIPCGVLGVEEMIASKIFVSRRERFDGADVAHLLRAQSRSLEWDRLVRLLGPHSELLLWSLVFYAYVYPARVNDIPQRIWEWLLSDFRKRIEAPRAKEPFRGTLIDPNMFSIDVTDWGERDLYSELCSDYPKMLKETTREGK
jgi:Nucleotidyl transferase of unknown function (DUF2204)